MQFGWTADERASFAVMDAYVEAGGNFIDTADIYSGWVKGHRGGESEEVIGRWLKRRGRRDDVIIATKVRGKMWEGRDGEGLSREHIMRAAEDSLRRLGVETIDLYQCHWFDEKVPIEETLRAFEDLTNAGKIRFVGASNYPASRLKEALDVAEAVGVPGFVSLQPHHNLVHRAEFEEGLRALCIEHDLAVLPYSPLAAGFLTGKYERGNSPATSARAQGVRKYMSETGWATIDAVLAVAAARDATPATVSLAWSIAQPGITAPIVGANTVEQLQQLFPATELALGDEELATLDAVSTGRTTNEAKQPGG